MKRVIFIIVALTLILRAQAAPFGKTSFLTYGQLSSAAAIYEFDYNGTLIQTITFPGYTNALQGQLNSDGTLISLALRQTVPESLAVCVVLNANGELMGDSTKIDSVEYVDCNINGTDVWLNTYRAIAYAKSGTVKTVTSANVVQFATFIGSTQLIGSRLYMQTKSGSVYFQDPVQTIDNGNVAVFPFIASSSYVYKQNVIYTFAGTALKRYNLAPNNVATLAYSYTLQTSFDAILSMTAADYNGATYLFVSYLHNTSPHSVLRLIDDGTAFSGEKLLIGDTTHSSGISIVPTATCSDGYKDQDETDIDCGGSTCSTCANDKSCLVNDDCTNSFCDPNNKCATPTCADTYKNQDETDVDCGGTKCSKCDNGKVCSADNDCSSGFCDPNNGNKCATPSCLDSSKNQDETDVDCGGSNCSGCDLGLACLADSDCTSTFCDANNECATPTCSDSIKNQDETDVDCGGLKCSACVIGESCLINSDCAGNKCSSNFCIASCMDNIFNQDETDVDCGGSCPACVDGQKCLQQADCETDYCNPNSICAIPSCNDGWKNEDETDVDCGGQTCIKCNVGSTCLVNSDCSSNTCSSNLCAVPPPTPVDTPVNDQSPQSESPVSSQPSSVNSPATTTPVSKKVSSGVAVEAAVLGLGGIVVINLM